MGPDRGRANGTGALRGQRTRVVDPERRGSVMNLPLRCYRCGVSLAELSLPLSRLDECPECRAQLHVCRMCQHYAPRLADACSEDDALEVRDKEAANFCDYFAPSPLAHEAADVAEAQRAEAKLRALFGDDADSGAASGAGDQDETDEALRRAEALFKK
jgi:hypothetical protein